MPPLLQAALTAILRQALTLGAGYLVSRGIWTQEEMKTYVGALVLFALSFGWSLWGKYRSRLSFLTALESTTENEVKAKIATGTGAGMTRMGTGDGTLK